MPDIFEEFSRQVPEGVLPSGLKEKTAKAALGGTAALATAAMGYDPREVAEDAKQLAQALKTEYVEPLRQYMPENMRLGVSGLLSDPAATASYRGGLGLNIPVSWLAVVRQWGRAVCATTPPHWPIARPTCRA